jgi:hypothetical protein
MKMALVAMLAACAGCTESDELPDGAVRMDLDTCCKDFTGGRSDSGTWHLGTETSGNLLILIPIGRGYDIVGTVQDVGFTASGHPGDVITVYVNAFAVAGESVQPLIEELPIRGGRIVIPLPPKHGDTVLVLPHSESGTIEISDPFFTVR